LAGGIAHDFNNIITAILAYASLLDHSLEPNDERRADVQEIGRAAARAAELTAQLLAYARKQVVEPRTIDVNVLVRETERLLRRLIGEQLHLVVTVAENVWPVRIDPAQFEQMLVNLAINARDAMPDGGTLTVSTENVTLRAEDLPQAASGAGDYVRLCVRDTGHGIAPNVRARIFEPFFTTKDIGKGTGLGLASVFGTIQQAGGAIDVQSEPGEGATFIIFLPRDAKDAALAGGSRAVVAPGAGVGEYILLVEDEPAVLHSTTRALERAGFRVLAATSVAEARTVMQVQGASVRVVICDEGLPDGSGQALLMRLRAEWPALGVLCTSGYAEAGAVVDGAPFIAKPYAPSDITRAVQELLDA
jgi:CheY-like chemotaxis protein